MFRRPFPFRRPATALVSSKRTCVVAAAARCVAISLPSSGRVPPRPASATTSVLIARGCVARGSSIAT
eukprot:4351793-Lingulodinium_polyedra.AAC.1